jgi:hypothetical protein
MTPREAAELIETIAESFRQQPTQVHYEVSITQFGGSGSYTASPTINADTDTVIGFQAGGQIEVGGQVSIQPQQAMGQYIDGLVETLRSMTAELRADQPDKGRLDKWVGMLRDKAAPPAIVALVKRLIEIIGFSREAQTNL